jgi:hypothetical protein
MEARGSTGSVLEGHVRLSSAPDLLQIRRSGPCRPYSWIVLPDVAAMKAWKKLTAILKAGGEMWTAEIMRQSSKT